jgi:hypothetical protein
MTDYDPKYWLHYYLKSAREAVLWKLDGLSEYDVRRPVTPTGTNLLGVVKHLAGTDAAYFGLVFGRPLPDPPAWMAEDAEVNADMWVTPEESREDITGLYRRVWAHSDATIEALALDDEGHVPWWGDRNPVTLHWILIHMIAETDQHRGHMDIVREMVDGATGLRAANANLPEENEAWWQAYRERLEQAARQAAG